MSLAGESAEVRGDATEAMKRLGGDSLLMGCAEQVKAGLLYVSGRLVEVEETQAPARFVPEPVKPPPLHLLRIMTHQKFPESSDSSSPTSTTLSKTYAADIVMRVAKQVVLLLPNSD